MLQVASPSTAPVAGEPDLVLTGVPAADAAPLVDLLVATLRHAHTPAAVAQGLHDFQLTRGLLGVSA